MHFRRRWEHPENMHTPHRKTPDIWKVTAQNFEELWELRNSPNHCTTMLPNSILHTSTVKRIKASERIVHLCFLSLQTCAQEQTRDISGTSSHTLKDTFRSLDLNLLQLNAQISQALQNQDICSLCP